MEILSISLFLHTKRHWQFSRLSAGKICFRGYHVALLRESDVTSSQSKSDREQTIGTSEQLNARFCLVHHCYSQADCLCYKSSGAELIPALLLSSKMRFGLADSSDESDDDDLVSLASFSSDDSDDYPGPSA